VARTTLEQMAAFVLAYCQEHANTVRYPCDRGVESILRDTRALPTVTAQRAALYGFAVAVGAARAPGFDPAWKPT
jgi:hypothetical protein